MLPGLPAPSFRVKLLGSANDWVQLGDAGLLVPGLGMSDVKPKFWLMPRGSVCLMILISPQFAIWVFWTSMSSGDEVKLDPDERDSQTCCGKATHVEALRPSASVKLTPNSANWLTPIAVLLIPLSAAAMADWFDCPSNRLDCTRTAVAPQQGRGSVLTKQVPPGGFVHAGPWPAHGSVLSIHVSRWKTRPVPPLMKS